MSRLRRRGREGYGGAFGDTQGYVQYLDATHANKIPDMYNRYNEQWYGII